MTTQVTTTGITFNDNTVQTTAATPSYIQSQSAAVDIQTFNSTGTWTKPTGGQKFARIQIWGAGGAGSNVNQNGCPGAGGGGYSEVIVPLSYLSATATATVGAGGSSGSGPGGLIGSYGGDSSFPIDGAGAPKAGTFYAYGGSGADAFDLNNVHGGVGFTENGGDYITSANRIFAGAAGAFKDGSGSNATCTSTFGGSSGSTYTSAGQAPGGGGGAGTRGGAAGRVVVTCW